jgi:hypothetical protein
LIYIVILINDNKFHQNSDGDVSSMNWFVDKFNQRCSAMNKVYLDVNDLDAITADVEVINLILFMILLLLLL